VQRAIDAQVKDCPVSVFRDYELLRTSGLFDPEYYLATYPDVADANIDPLIHYLEQGAREGRNPMLGFDAARYLSQCQMLGETPDNPLLHFITVGVQRGLDGSATIPSTVSREIENNKNNRSNVTKDAARLAATVTPKDSFDPLLYVDFPRISDGVAEALVRGGLSISGWAIGAGDEVRVEIGINGQVAAIANHGIRRPDVALAHPKRSNALKSGYVAHVPPKVLTVGRHVVTVTLFEAGKALLRGEFQIEVDDIKDNHGPWSLRKKISQAELDTALMALTRLGRRPSFSILLSSLCSELELAHARRSLASLAGQAYTDWQIYLLPGGGRRISARHLNAWRDRLLVGFEDVAEKVAVFDGQSLKCADDHRNISLVSILAAGDEWGCDALLEFALASARAPAADFLYSDDRRWCDGAAVVEAYFKPQWSPDLLLSTNYIGRAWCARADLLERAGVTAAELLMLSDFARVLRLTEVAATPLHVPKVLCEHCKQHAESAVSAHQALADALKRRAIIAEIESGRAGNHFRVKRQITHPGKVSIIIPTCARDGMIETCIETLRAQTRSRDYEIVCIENIPTVQLRDRAWLRLHADRVIETDEPFNWSRFNNLAAAHATGRYLLFLNDDVEIIEPDWLEALVEHAQRPEIGVVGPQLLYPSRRVQHAGVMLDELGRGRHAFRHLAEDDPGYFGLALTQRNVIGVTGACLMVRREVFDRVGRFNEAHAIINNDLDFCLRVWDHGLLNVYTPYARLIHHELVSRASLGEAYDAAAFKQCWRKLIADGDPYFNPQLSREHEQFTIEREPLQILHGGGPLYAKQSIRRILVVKLDHIGDCITALPAVRQLKQHFPHAQLTVLAGASTMAIWKNEPSVDDTIEFSFFNARSGLGKIERADSEFEALGETLERRRFDLAIDLRKQPDTREILRLTGARLLVGYEHQGSFPWLDVAPAWDEDISLRPKHHHVSDDLITLVEALAARGDADRGRMAIPKGVLTLSQAEQERLFSCPLICVHPASGSAMRQWPLPHFVELIALLLDRKQVNVALIGGRDEKEFSAALMAELGARGSLFDIVGRIELPELPILLSRAVLFVGNNSGPQHWAAALGTPTIGIHSGVVDASEWAPQGVNAVAIRREMSCSPCFIEKPGDCPRACACLNTISAGEVYSLCDKMLQGSCGSRPADNESLSPLPVIGNREIGKKRRVMPSLATVSGL